MRSNTTGTRSRIVSLVAAATAGVALLVAPAPAADAGVCSGKAQVPAEALEHGMKANNCDLEGRWVVEGDLRVRVPAEGRGVVAHGVGVEGSEQEALTVVNEDGVVTAEVEEHAATAGTTAPTLSGARLSPCSDSAYAIGGARQHWGQTLRWRYQIGSTPTWLNRTTVVNQLRAAVTNMAAGRDDCNLAGDPRATASYLGTTTARPAVSQYSSTMMQCSSPDGGNVVGFGGAPSGVLGYTCYWWRTDTNTMVEADMLLAAKRSVRTTMPQSCFAKYDLQAIATHEWGHAFGLDHPSGTHDALTMSPYILDCTTAQRTLGKGDFLGMRTLYGL